MALYFGFPFDHGQVNQEYADMMEAIYNQADDIIFFSSQLCKELSEHGDELATSFKKHFGRNVPRIDETGFFESQGRPTNALTIKNMQTGLTCSSSGTICPPVGSDACAIGFGA